jgi:hypothetical protein
VKSSNGVDLGDGSLGVEGDGRGEELDSLVGVKGRLDVGAEGDVLLAVDGAEDGIGELGSGVGHREGGGSSSVLGLDDLISTELDALDESGESVSSSLNNLLALGGLREEGNDGGSRVTSDDGDGGVLGGGSSEARKERRRANDIEGGDTEEAVEESRIRACSSELGQRNSPLGVVDTGLLEDLGDDGDGRVDGVGNDTDASLGGRLGGSGSEITDDRGVGLRKEKGQRCRASSSRRTALTLKRSSRVIPGLRGTPAGMMTISAPSRAFLRPSCSGA